MNRSEPSSVGGKTLAGLPLSAGARPVRRLRTQVAVTGVPKSSPETGIRAGWESARRVVRRAFKNGEGGGGSTWYTKKGHGLLEQHEVTC